MFDDVMKQERLTLVKTCFTQTYQISRKKS